MRQGNLAVFRGGALGDLILTLPVLQRLRKACSEGTLTAVINHPFQQLLSPDLHAQQTAALDSQYFRPLFQMDAELPGDLRKTIRSFGSIISYLHDPDAVFRTNLERCGIQTFIQGPYQIEEGSIHATDQLAGVLKTIGSPCILDSPKVLFSAESGTSARSGIVLHTGSGSALKNWPMDRWAGIITHLLDHTDLSLTLVSGEAETGMINALRDTFFRTRLSFMTNERLADVAARLAGTSFYLGHDTGISHLAAASGCRCLLLFGPTDPRVWAPTNPGVTILRSKGQNMATLEANHVKSNLAAFLLGSNHLS